MDPDWDYDYDYDYDWLDTGGVVQSPGSVNDGSADFSICETAPGYYLRHRANAPTAAAGMDIQKAPEGWYAPGGEDVTTGNVLDLIARWELITTDAGTTAYDNAQLFLCPFGGSSAAGSSALTDCTPDCSDAAFAVDGSTGNCQCAAGYYGTADGTTTDGTGCNACPFGGSSDAGSSALTDCAPVCTAAAFDVDGSTGNCHCAAGYYGTADGTTTDGTGCDACPFGGNSAAGSSALTDCAPVCTAAAFDVDGSTGNCHCAAGYYGTADGTTTDGTGCDACPFGGTTLTAGSSALTDCAPDCATTNTNSGAVANGGTCECAANYYGSPLDAGGVTTAAASTGCTACSAGTTSTAGTTASSGCTGASPTAASPTAADSAGASTPIAVALAAAAAVPLLL